MHEHAGPRWVGPLLAVALAAVVGAWTYNLGLSQGLAAQLPASATGPYPWALYRPWGFGPFFPLFFLFFWFVAVRFFIRGGRRRGWGGYYYDRHGVPPMFEEWHRRAHDQEARPASPPPAQG